MHPDTVQTVVQIANQTTGESFYIELLKLAVFSLFVSATLQVFKDTYQRFNPAGLDKQTIKILNFVLAFAFCYVFDYGVMMRVIQGGVRLKGQFAPFLDYLATASVIYMGADWAFDKFAAMKAKLVASRKASEADQVVTTTSQSSSSVQKTSTVTAAEPK